MYRIGTSLEGNPLCAEILIASAAHSQTIRRRLGSVTLAGQGLGLGLGTSLFPVGAMEIKAPDLYA